MLKTMVGGSTHRGFITQWNTSNAGTSTSTQIKVPTLSTGSYNCVVQWGDGNTSTITTYNDAAWTHTYSGSGIYTVTITGTFTGIQFNNGGDCLKLLQIMQWGIFNPGSGGACFYGCANLTITAVDTMSTTSVTSLSSMFQGCSSIVAIPNIGTWNVGSVTNFTSAFQTATNFNSPLAAWNMGSATTIQLMFQAGKFNQPINAWNVSNVTNMQNVFAGNSTFNQSLASWNTVKVTNTSAMFQNATAFNQQIGAWNITALTSASSMFNGVTLSNTNYNQLLAGWGAQVAKTNVTFSGGNSHYDATTGGFNGTAGRAVLTGTYTWTITDGGTP